MIERAIVNENVLESKEFLSFLLDLSTEQIPVVLYKTPVVAERKTEQVRQLVSPRISSSDQLCGGTPFVATLTSPHHAGPYVGTQAPKLGRVQGLRGVNEATGELLIA